MKRVKYIFFVVFGALLLPLVVWGQGIPDAFVVEVDPSSFELNEAVDLTIKAVKSNGETVKDYEWDVFIEIPELFRPDEEFNVPSDGLYTFLPQDQWVKLFSKGLVIKVPGTFSVQVSDIIDESIKGKMTVIVGIVEEQETYSVEIISPVVGGVVTDIIIDVLAQTPDLPNSIFQVYVNDIMSSQGISTEKGDISAYASGFQVWQNTLQIKMVDINGLVIGQSQPISFTYQTSTDNIFNSIDVLPGTNIKQGEKVTFNIKTSDDVTSVELRFSDGSTYPMDRITAGSFSKQILAEIAGSMSVSLSVMVAGNKKLYTDVANFVVQESIAVTNIKFFTDEIDKTKLTVSWAPIGQIAKYKVEYGIDKSNLSFSQELAVTEIQLQNLDPEQIYYVRITPLDVSGIPIGTPSDAFQIEPGHLWPPGTSADEAPSCVVKGIVVSTGRIWNKYYLIWSAAENVERYVIYRSDWEGIDVTKMQKVGETTTTRFEYPFNNLSEVDQYSYYAVEAICTDGSIVQMDSIKRVHVGPLDNFLLVVVIALFLYVVYRLYVVGTRA